MNLRTKFLNYLQQRDRGWMLMLLMAVAIVYLPFLGNPFIFDDRPIFRGDILDHYTESLFRFELRWLPYATLGWTYALFSDVFPHLYRMFNALLHGINAILMFYLLRNLFGASAVEHEKSPQVIWGAWLGALLFACHPVAVYAVGYVVQLSILMATMFALLMQLAYLRGLLSGQVRWLALAVLAYFLAVFSKEHSVMMPAVLAAETVLLRSRIGATRVAMWLTWSALFGVGLLIVLLAKGVLGTPYEIMSVNMFEQQGILARGPILQLQSVMTQAGLFFKYLFLWLVPNTAWMSVDMREQFIPVWTAWQGWLGIAAFVAYGVIAAGLLLRGGRKGLLGLAMLYPWLLFFTEFSSIRIQEPFVLYRSYLWLPMLFLLIPLMLLRMPGRKWILILCAASVLLVLLSWNRLWVFSSDYRLWNDAVQLLPSDKVAGADRVFYNRAEAYALAGNWKEAANDFERAVALSPKLPQLHKELGVSYANLGYDQKAIMQFDEAIALEPKFAVAYYYKGLILKRQHKDELAMQQMKKSCELEYAMACVIVKFEPPKK